MPIAAVQPTQKDPLYDQVYRAIKQGIAAGAFRPGQALSEVQLSETLEVSRTPVREAVRRLIAENLLEATPRGLRVYSPTPSDLADVYFTRAVLEGSAARLAAVNANADFIDRLSGITNQCREAVASQQGDLAARLNGQFHWLVVDRGGNKRLVDLLSSLDPVIVRYRHVSLMFPDHLQRSYEDHCRIVELFRNGTPASVEAFVRDHILRAGSRIVAAVLRMEGSPADPSVPGLALLREYEPDRA